jgi:hypothetical protein
LTPVPSSDAHRTVDAVWSTVATALVSGGSAVAGGLVVAGSNYAISRAQSRGARIGDLRQALTALLAVLGQVETELRSEPRTKRTVRFVNEQVQSRFPQIDYITDRLHRRIFQPHLDGLVMRFHDAMAATLLTAPPELLPALQTMAEAMESPAAQSDEWWMAWEAARAGLVVGSRRVLGYEVPSRSKDSGSP